MLTIGAYALVTPDATLNGLPPTRQQGRPRRGGGVSRFVRSIRQAIADAANEPTDWLPRIRNYPY